MKFLRPKFLIVITISILSIQLQVLRKKEEKRREKVDWHSSEAALIREDEDEEGEEEIPLKVQRFDLLAPAIVVLSLIERGLI